MLHLGADGTLSLNPLFGPVPEPGDWRDPVIDALKGGDIERARKVLEDNKDEPIVQEPEAQCYTLPIFTCDSIEQARQIQVRFCRLMIGDHPCAPGERWYVVSRFGEGLEELYRVQGEISAWYKAITAKARSKRRTRKARAA